MSIVEPATEKNRDGDANADTVNQCFQPLQHLKIGINDDDYDNDSDDDEGDHRVTMRTLMVANKVNQYVLRI